jgi:DNA-binding response OmpR family regulator
VQWVLEDDGWPVRSASDGHQAVEQAMKDRPTLVVLDIGLPGIDGEQVASRIHGLYVGVPVLVISSDGMAAEHDRNARAYAYLDKPFELEALRSAVVEGFQRNESRHAG